VEINLKKFLGF